MAPKIRIDLGKDRVIIDKTKKKKNRFIPSESILFSF